LTPSPTGPDATRWWLVLLAVSGGIIAATYIGKVPPSLPMQRAELGIGLVAAGWVVSMLNIVGALFGIVAGSLGDRFGIRRVVLTGLAVLAVGGSLGAVSGSAAMLLFSRLLEGVGFIAVAAATPGLIIAVTQPRDLRLALGIWSTYVPSGAALALLLSPLLLPQLGWRGLWLVIAVLTALWWALTLRYTPPDPPRLRQAGGTTLQANLRATMGRAGPWLLAGCFFCYVVQWVTLTSWLPTYLVEERGMAVGTAALFTALVVASNIPGNILGGWLLHRHVPHWLLILLSALVTGASLAGIFNPDLPDLARAALCLTFTALGGMLPPAVMSAVPVVAPARAQLATTSGLVIQGSNIGQLFGPPFAALLVTLTGVWEANFWMLEGAAIATVGLALAFRVYDRPS
jgi:predicted MFS family arabinose efflux permease